MSDERLKKTDYLVRPISINIARQLIEKFHYAGSATNTGVYFHGLFKKGEEFFDSQCLGVAWWLPPTKNAAIATYDGEWQKVLSLTRMAINPVVPKNAASFLLGNSIKLIDKKKWHCLVTYADTWRNHTGAIYRANNWEYLGLTKPTPVYQNHQGKMMGRKRGGKNLTKIELECLGFFKVGEFSKHKFRKIII